MFDSIKIKSIYRTKNDDFDEDFLIPLLKNCKTYYRGTGYFNIQALINISKGLIPFIKNGGSMKLITSVELAFDEINLLNVSSEVAMNTITAELEKIIEKQLNDESDILTMDLITNLIAANRIEVKIAYLPNGGLYHEKIGYLEDFEENKVCFIGSNNETHSGQKRNAETISIIKSWDGGEEDTIGEKQYFENLWKNKEKEIEVVNFPTAAKNKLFSIYRKSSSYEESIKRIEEYYERLKIDSGKKELYKYQEKTIDEFCNNKYCHFYEMATGTGKTFTAVKSVERMSNDMNGKSLYVIVVVPQIDLQEQWKNAFKEIDTKTYLFGGNSTNKDWELELSKSIIDYYNGEKIIVSICIYDTFFSKISKKLEGQKRINKLLIIDEAHELSKNQINMLSEDYKFRLGLSATPERHKESETTQIINYFTRGNVETYKYTIDEAINNGFLSRYEYHPIKVYLEEDEFEKYKKYTLQLAQLLNAEDSDEDKIQEILNNRSIIVKKARNKTTRLQNMASDSKYDFRNSVVYCGQGKDVETEEAIIDSVTIALKEQGKYRVSQFTSKTIDRTTVLKEFENGYYDTLVAIKCFDQGVDVPKLDKIYIMASDTLARQTIQRRGRVLRKCKETGKTIAYIFDFVCLPPEGVYDSAGASSLVAKELKRVKEYGRLSENKINVDAFMEELINDYNVTEDSYDEEENDGQ